MTKLTEEERARLVKALTTKARAIIAGRGHRDGHVTLHDVDDAVAVAVLTTEMVLAGALPIDAVETVE